MKQYLETLQHVLEHGESKADRTNTGTLSLFGHQVKFDVSESFPLLTTKKMAFKTMVTELLWFLKGDTNIRYLVNNGCNLWNGDAYKNFLTKTKISSVNQEEFLRRIKEDPDFSDTWGELGPIYGKQWRDFNGVDQIKWVIEEIKNNPTSRRLIVSAWNPADLKAMVLPPCHLLFQFQVSGLKTDSPRLNLMWTQRSVDLPLGLPMNIASYALLLRIIAKETGYQAGELIANLGDLHIYLNQVEGVREQLTREPKNAPQLEISDRKVSDVSEYEVSDFKLVGYSSHPKIYFPLSN